MSISYVVYEHSKRKCVYSTWLHWYRSDYSQTWSVTKLPTYYTRTDLFYLYQSIDSSSQFVYLYRIFTGTWNPFRTIVVTAYSPLQCYTPNSLALAISSVFSHHRTAHSSGFFCRSKPSPVCLLVLQTSCTRRDVTQSRAFHWRIASFLCDFRRVT